MSNNKKQDINDKFPEIALWILSEIRTQSLYQNTVDASYSTFESIMSIYCPSSDMYDSNKFGRIILTAMLDFLERNSYISIIKNEGYCDQIELLPAGWKANIDYEKLNNHILKIVDENNIIKG